VKTGSARYCSDVDLSINRTYGMLPASRIHSAVSRGNARPSYQLWEKNTQEAVFPDACS